MCLVSSIHNAESMFHSFALLLFPLASFVWRLRKHPLYLAHLSHSSLSLSFYRSSLSFSSHTFLSCSRLIPLLIYIFSGFVSSFTVHSRLSGSFPSNPFPLLLLFSFPMLLLTKGFPLFVLKSSLTFILSFLWCRQVAGDIVFRFMCKI